jgi:elongation factor G
MIKERLGARPVPVQLPIGSEDKFNGIIDLISNKAIYYTDDLGTRSSETEIPEEMADLAAEMREKLLEAAAEQDEELMVKYLEGEQITKEEIVRALRTGTVNVNMVPVLCGSSYHNKGVQLLLDAVVAFLPSPLDVPPVRGILTESGLKPQSVPEGCGLFPVYKL